VVLVAPDASRNTADGSGVGDSIAAVLGLVLGVSLGKALGTSLGMDDDSAGCKLGSSEGMSSSSSLPLVGTDALAGALVGSKAGAFVGLEAGAGATTGALKAMGACTLSSGICGALSDMGAAIILSSGTCSSLKRRRCWSSGSEWTTTLVDRVVTRCKSDAFAPDAEITTTKIVTPTTHRPTRYSAQHRRTILSYLLVSFEMRPRKIWVREWTNTHLKRWQCLWDGKEGSHAGHRHI
jgi:hypothetical protein